MFLIAVLAATLFAGPAPERGTLRGEVAVESIGTHGVAIFVDTNRDASFDHRFVLSFEGAEREATARERDLDRAAIPDREIPTPLHFDDATIHFDIGYVRVAAGETAFEAFVEGTQSAAWNPAGSRVWRRAGYGLSHHAFETGVPIRRSGRGRSIMAEYCDASSDCNPDDTGGEGGAGNSTACDSGGPGSTTCSISDTGGSCSVTCSGSFYACCMHIQGSAPRCKCARP